jgi:hypothetical protein
VEQRGGLAAVPGGKEKLNRGFTLIPVFQLVDCSKECDI